MTVVQKTRLLGMARIPRKVLTSECHESVPKEPLVLCFDSLPWVVGQ